MRIPVLLTVLCVLACAPVNATQSRYERQAIAIMKKIDKFKAGLPAGMVEKSFLDKKSYSYGDALEVQKVMLMITAAKAAEMEAVKN